MMRHALLFALVFCGVASGGDPEVDKWIKVMATPAESRPFEALNRLVALGPKAIPASLKLYRDTGAAPARRWQAAKVLGGLKAKEAVKDLCKGLTDSNWAVAACSAEALGEIGDQSAVPKMRKALERTRHPQVKEAIGKSIGKLTGTMPEPAAEPDVPCTAILGLAFESMPKTALERARKEKKFVLTLVRAAFRDDPGATFPEETLIACALRHPDVATLIERRFVPLRMSYTPWLHTIAKRDSRDPLPAIGTHATRAKAPALVVTTAGGRQVATLGSIGTYDAWLVFRFLSDALLKAKDRARSKKPGELLAVGQLEAARKSALKIGGDEGSYWLARTDSLAGDPEAALAKVGPLARKGSKFLVEAGIAQMRLGRFEEAKSSLEGAAKQKSARRDEARYYLGCLLYREGDRDGAKKLWLKIPEDSAWARKVEARAKWPERMDMFECLRAPRIHPEMGATETVGDATVIPRALDYLAAQQQPDGSWINPTRYLHTEPAITALCVRALFEHQVHPDAVERATKWLRDYLKREDPAEANGWSSAYILDYFLARLRADKAFGKDAQRAVAFALGGQCPNGAWSYGRNWGLRWKGGIGGWPKTEEGRFHSVNTGPCMVSLLDARELGLKVSAAALQRGQEALLAMREEPGIWTYTYPVPRNFNEEPQHSIGRAPTCELALFKLGAAPREDLVKTLGYFMEFRGGLRKSVKLSASWLPPELASSYFYHFAYHHAAGALDVLGDQEARESLRQDLLEVVEADGTWLDYEQTGKPYATAMALLVLRSERP